MISSISNYVISIYVIGNYMISRTSVEAMYEGYSNSSVMNGFPYARTMYA